MSRLGTLLFSDAWCRLEQAGHQGGAQTKHYGAKMLLQVGKSGFREYDSEGINFACNPSQKMTRQRLVEDSAKFRV